MRTVCEINNCNLCTACVTVCPKGCIKLEDTIEFSNAIIDEKECINCKLCEKVCPRVTKLHGNEPLQWLNAYAKDSEIRNASSSGGIASLISYKCLEENFYIAGCKYSKDSKSFITSLENTYDEVEKFRGSKYVKSDMQDVIKDIVKKLQENKKVLFIGTPCQVAGVKSVVSLKKLEDNLYTIDLICHGTPSQKIFDKFISEYKISEEIDRFNFRKHYVMQVSINNYKSLEKFKVMDAYMIGFLKGLFYTENCYSCMYANTQRISDITLGDSWESSVVKKGLSLVIINTAKGMQLFNLIKENISFSDANKDLAIKHNSQLSQASSKLKQRVKFYKHYNKISFKKNIFNCFKMMYLKQSIKKIFYRR